MRRGAAARPNIGGATSYSPGWPTARIAPTRRPPSNRSRWAASNRIPSAFTTWAAASINGWRIVGIRPIRARHRTDRHGPQVIVAPTSFGPAHGRTTRVMFARQTALVTTPTFDIQPMVSVSHYRRRTIEEKEIYEDYPGRDAVRVAYITAFCGPRPRKACRQG